ncbi:hypothetical protein BJ878DRAFT_304250 [Calycina marina]|uniref:Proteasome subunit beta type protein n=1 Tax=Calycina marina TaxID=1763456 RepID=A0A9P8CB75_9HELO|nr:hypothetical protein BJ878DRAFT_304250 [Calycina marina]
MANIADMDFSADSHELVMREAKVKGAVQQTGNDDLLDRSSIRNLGWHKPTANIPDPLIGEIPNGQLWALIRRFNKDVFDVRSVPASIARGLDLNEAWADDHATDKMTMHLERAYIAIFLNLASFGKQVARVRSWKERRRTLTFCIAYFAAWLFDMLMPLTFGLLVVVASSPQARDVLFPPAPRSLVSINTGRLQNPPAGQLGTTDSLTGAPEKQVGEAVEEEAANFIDNLRHLLMRTVGMHESGEEDGDPLEGKVPTPIRKGVRNIQAEGAAAGHITEETETQAPMENIIWARAKPENLTPVLKKVPHLVGEIVDNCERFANVISPTTPFSPLSFLRIDALLIPLLLGSFLVNYYMVYKATGFAIGFLIFGGPIITPALERLNRDYPGWLQALEPKNNILRGVPTNNQLTLSLLRIGEAHHSPIPPVPDSVPNDLAHGLVPDVKSMPFANTNTEILTATQPALDVASETDKVEEDKEEQPKHKHISRAIGFLKGNTKAIAKTKLAADHVRAAAGSEKSKGHLGILPKPEKVVFAGPSEFKARLEGKKGWLCIRDTTLLFTTQDVRAGGDALLNPAFTIVIKDIKRLKRATASANKISQKAAEWTDGRELLDSVEIDDLSGKTWRFTALPERDEVFNRLISIGSQRWENV